MSLNSSTRSHAAKGFFIERPHYIEAIFQVHHIDRHELQIDSVSLCTKLGIAVTVTRNCIGIWDLLTGKLK